MKVKPETVEARNQRRLWAAIDEAIRTWQHGLSATPREIDYPMYDLRELRDELKPKWIKD